jgi:hypothetical protein
LALLSYPSGYLLGRLYPPLALEDFWRRAAVRALLGLAIWPVVVALASLLGLRLTGTAVAIYVAVTAAATLVLALPSLVRSLTAPLPSPSSGDYVSKRGYAIAMPGTHSLALLVILLAALGLRWWQAREAVWPLWGDAVNHTAATALILEHGGIPPNWEPFIPTSQTFAYHFGFHTWAAVVSWLTPVEPWWAVFWTERFLNALTPLSLYLLALVLFGDRRVGIGAALASGLLTLMPQYYVNWSRDPQLGGQVLLPLLAYLVLAARAHRPARLRAALLLAVALASLVFVHYRVLVFALGLACGLAVLALTEGRRRWQSLILPGGAAAVGVAAGVPWVWHVLTVQREVAALAPVSYAQGYVDAYFGVPPLWEYVHPELLALACLGALAGLVRWRRQLGAILVWMLFLILAANGYRTGRSSLSLITYISVFMALYLPLSLGVGMALEALLRRAGTPATERPLLAGALLLALPVGFLWHGDILDETYVLVRAEDVRTFDWIRANTSDEARFLVNSFSASGEGGVVVGSDAGWWLTLATGRGASLPVINYGTEVVSPGYVAQVRHLSQLSAEDPAAPEALAAFCQAGLTHVFIGSVGGPIPTERLLDHPSFRLLHQDGGAHVFALDCAP